MYAGNKEYETGFNYLLKNDDILKRMMMQFKEVLVRNVWVEFWKRKKIEQGNIYIHGLLKV